ncbi:HAD family hydrolase [Corynebacterium sp. CCM 9204]
MSEQLPTQDVTTAPVAAFFDLDKTVIARSSAYAYGREFMNNGLITPAEALKMTLAQSTYMLAGHSSEQMDSTRDHLASMVAGWDVEQVRGIVEETLHSVVTPAIYAEARALIEQHRARGHDVIIISASAAELVEPIARELGVHRIVTTRLGTEHGKFTGEVLFYCKGAAKRQALLDLAREHSYNLDRSFAYSDSATDIPMLEAVGTAVAVNPDRPLKKTALQRGWEIRTFKNPEPLFQMPSSRDVGIGTGIAAGIAAVTVGGFWLARRARA